MERQVVAGPGKIPRFACAADVSAAVDTTATLLADDVSIDRPLQIEH
jgi:hypothetical protein